MSNRFQGVFWLTVSAALAVWAYFDYTFFKPILIVVTAVYGILQLARHRIIRSNLVLSGSELDLFGEKLSEATPEILRLFEENSSVNEVAEELERDFGLPKEITLKYIIALGRYHEDNS